MTNFKNVSSGLNVEVSMDLSTWLHRGFGIHLQYDLCFGTNTTHPPTALSPSLQPFTPRHRGLHSTSSLHSGEGAALSGWVKHNGDGQE